MRASFFRLIHRDLHKRIGSDKERRISAALIAAAGLTPQQAYERLETSPRGLTRKEARARLEKFGRNLIVQEKAMPWWVQLLAAFKSPFNLVLFTLAAVSYFTKDYTGMTIILVMVLAAASLKFIQEYHSNKSAEALRTEKIPLLQSNASVQLILSSAVLMALGVWLPYTGLGRDIGFSPLPGVYYLWAAAILMGYCLAAQGVKRLYIRRFRSWL